jgi:hypothetical protein
METEWQEADYIYYRTIDGESRGLSKYRECATIIWYRSEGVFIKTRIIDRPCIQR